MIRYQELNQSIYSITIIWHTVLRGQFYRIFENKYTHLQMEVVSELSCE